MSEWYEAIAPMLRPAGGGVHLVSTGRAEQLALQMQLYHAADEADVAAAHRRALRDAAHAKVVVLGIPSDVGAGFRRGANLGPMELRRAWQAAQPGLPTWWRAQGVVDLGDIFCVPQLSHDELLGDAQLQRSRDALYPELSAVARQRLPVSPLSMAERVLGALLAVNPAVRLLVLGGDHSCAWPVVAALTEADADLCILQFDAHTDLLEHRLGVRYCFATWSWHASQRIGGGGRMTQVGIRATRHERAHWEHTTEVRQFWADECNADPQRAAAHVIEHLRAVGCKRLYLSNDIDGTDEAFASATGTPEPNGLSPEFVEALIRQAGAEFELVAGDLMEVAPTVAAPAGGLESTLQLGVRYLCATLDGLLRR